MNAPTQSVTNKLYGLSRGLCAFPGCTARIVEVEGNVMGEICHIKARQPTGARYDPAQTDEERFGFANLILLCRNHHERIDNQPGNYPVESLRKMKEDHERKDIVELSLEDARFAKLLLESYKTRNVQITAGDHSQVMLDSAGGVQVSQNFYPRPPTVKNVIERRPDSVSREQEHQILQWIGDLAENTLGKPRDQAYRLWHSRFKKKFTLAKYVELPAIQFAEAETWHRQQRAMQKEGLRRKEPEEWRKQKYAAIKAAMKKMGRDSETYYPEIAARLKMVKPFTSLTQLTGVNLKRVYTMVLSDQRESLET